MPDDAFTFRPVTDADLPFVLACQTSDAAAPWFAPLTLDQARARFGDRLAGRSPIRMVIAHLRSRDAGHAQLYRVGDLPTDGFIPADARDVGLDYCLAGDLVGQGLGTPFVASLVGLASWLFPDAPGAVACPDHRNRASIAVLERAGFTAGLWFDTPGPAGGSITEIAYRRAIPAAEY